MGRAVMAGQRANQKLERGSILTFMHSTFRTARRILIGGLALALFVATTSGQAPAGQGPSEANHFIATPKGWVHGRTPWGDPDLQGMWPISYVGSVPLE